MRVEAIKFMHLYCVYIVRIKLHEKTPEDTQFRSMQ